MFKTRLKDSDDDGTDLRSNDARALLEYGFGVEYEHVDAGKGQETQQAHDGDGRAHRGPGRYQVGQVAAPLLFLLELLLQFFQFARDVVVDSPQQQQRVFRLFPLAFAQQVRGRLGRDQYHQNEHDHRYDAAQQRELFVRNERPDGVHVQYSQSHLHLDVRAEFTWKRSTSCGELWQQRQCYNSVRTRCGGREHASTPKVLNSFTFLNVV